ncbi:MAG: GerMN domain-containing protein [Gemmatimonadales bacterium]|nr:GerMN domain-containing protein [Gemmatimonadales bacterium]
MNVRILAVLCLGPGGLLGCRADAARDTAGGGPAVIELTIFLSDEQGIIDGDCAAVASEVRTIPALPADQLPEAAIREVLRDVIPSSGLHSTGTLPLLDYFNGVSIQNGTAILRFDGGALEYLNNAACAQIAVKSPMERTLLEFPDVQRIEYEIDGQIFDEWDA